MYASVANCGLAATLRARAHGVGREYINDGTCI